MEKGVSGGVVNTIHYCHDAFITIVVPLLSIRSKGFPSTVPTQLTLGKTTNASREQERAPDHFVSTDTRTYNRIWKISFVTEVRCRQNFWRFLDGVWESQQWAKISSTSGNLGNLGQVAKRTNFSSFADNERSDESSENLSRSRVCQYRRCVYPKIVSSGDATCLETWSTAFIASQTQKNIIKTRTNSGITRRVPSCEQISTTIQRRVDKMVATLGWLKNNHRSPTKVKENSSLNIMLRSRQHECGHYRVVKTRKTHPNHSISHSLCVEK